MTITRLESRIARLEQYRKPQASYVVHISQPRTPEEPATIARAKAQGLKRFHCAGPFQCLFLSNSSNAAINLTARPAGENISLLVAPYLRDVLKTLA
jgi:hypothetical protein